MESEMKNMLFLIFVTSIPQMSFGNELEEADIVADYGMVQDFSGELTYHRIQKAQFERLYSLSDEREKVYSRFHVLSEDGFHCLVSRWHLAKAGYVTEWQLHRLGKDLEAGQKVIHCHYDDEVSNPVSQDDLISVTIKKNE